MPITSQQLTKRVIKALPTESEKKRIISYAEKENLSLSKFLLKCVRFYLNEQKKVVQPK